ncbi:MAG TPA: HAD-IB family hydrolase, partial [Pseudogracilibacillus sp.]|nr:HAD-IB family hydrolase [Pseudogracilibacillus sp.]
STRKKVVINDAFRGQHIDWQNSFAYGDSYSDLSVLDLVGNPIAVKPDNKLREIAVSKNWEIMD